MAFSQPEGSNADSATVQLVNFLNSCQIEEFTIVERDDSYITIVYKIK